MSALAAETAAVQICQEAARLVGGDRENQHGDKLANFQNIADIWNAILAAKRRHSNDPLLSPLDVANMMEAMKIARRYSGAHNRDDYVDGAGYAGVAGHLAEALKG